MIINRNKQVEAHKQYRVDKKYSQENKFYNKKQKALVRMIGHN